MNYLFYFLGLFCFFLQPARADDNDYTRDAIRNEYQKSIEDLREFVAFLSNPNLNATDCSSIIVKKQEWGEISARVELAITVNSGHVFNIVIEPKRTYVAGEKGTSLDFRSHSFMDPARPPRIFDFTIHAVEIDRRDGTYFITKTNFKATFRDSPYYYDKTYIPADGKLTSFSMSVVRKDESAHKGRSIDPYENTFCREKRLL